MVAEMDLQDEKWVQMNGKLVPIKKLEGLAREDVEVCIKWYTFWLERINSPSQNSCLRRWLKNMDIAAKRLRLILFLKCTAPSHPSPCRVKVPSTAVDEISEVELIPSFFFEEVVNSIPSTVDEEDDSMNLGLIPSFFFHEENDLSVDEYSQYEKVEKTDVIKVIRSNDFNIWEVYQFTNNDVNELLVRNWVQIFSEPHKNIQCLNKLLFLYSKFLGMACFHFQLDASRLSFDRGKSVVLSSKYNDNLLRLIIYFGYKPNCSYMQSIHLLCVNDAEVYDERNMFVKMSESKAVKLGSVGVDFLLQLKIGEVIDRGKESDGITMFSNHVGEYDCGFVPFTPSLNFILGSVVLDIYNEYPSELHFLNSLSLGFVCVVEIGGGWKLVADLSMRNRFFILLFAKMVRISKAHNWYAPVLDMKESEFFELLMDIVCFELNFFFNHTLHTRISSRCCLQYAANVFDPGKGFQLVKGLVSFIYESEDYLDALTSYIIILLGLIFMDVYCDTSYYEINSELWYCFKLLIGYSSVSLSVINGDIRAVIQTFYTRPQQRSILWTKRILQVPKQSKPDNELFLPAKLLAGFRFCFAKVVTSGSFILHVGSKLLTYYNGKFAHRLIGMHGFESDSSFSGKFFRKLSPENNITMNTFLSMLILLCEIANVYELFPHMLDMWEEDSFLFQLKYVSPDALFICQLESLGVGFIRLRKAVFKPATALSNQVIQILNSYVTLARLHDYSIRIILAIVRSCFRLLKMGLFFSSLRITSAAIQEDEMQKSLHSTTNALHRLYFVPNKPPRCHYWLYVGYRTMSGYGRMRIIQLVLTVTHAPPVSKSVDFLRWKYKFHSLNLESAANVRLLVGYLRWKFRLFLTGWWGNRYYAERIHTQIVESCVTRLLCVLVGRLEQFEILFLDKLVGSIVWRRNCSDADIFLQLQLVFHNTSQKSYYTVQALQVYFLSGNYLKWKFKFCYTGIWNARIEFMKDTLYYPTTYAFQTDNSKCNSVLVGMFSQFWNFDGCAPRSFLKLVLSVSTLLIVPTGEVKVDFEVCNGIIRIIIGLDKFLELSSSFVFDRGKMDYSWIDIQDRFSPTQLCNFILTGLVLKWVRRQYPRSWKEIREWEK